MLTQRLLAFSRKQSLQPHAVEMKPLLENLSELMRHSLPATLTLDIEAQTPARPHGLTSASWKTPLSTR